MVSGATVEGDGGMATRPILIGAGLILLQDIENPGGDLSFGQPLVGFVLAISRASSRI